MIEEGGQKAEKDKDGAPAWSALSLAWGLGYTIAIPIVVLALAGRFLDKKFNTSPLFLLLGVFLSTVVSTIGVYFKAKKIIK